MLDHLHEMVVQKHLAIPEEFDKLIISLRTAYANELLLDKNQISFNDSFDALRLSLPFFKISAR